MLPHHMVKNTGFQGILKEMAGTICDQVVVFVPLGS